MAGAKKKKKPVTNPARGFATTSVASSKPRQEVPDVTPTIESKLANIVSVDDTAKSAAPDTSSTKIPAEISPEDFEKQLYESELQVLVEKHSQKSKREATRQIARLQTDRRILRTQADTLNTRKWLPPELMDEVLEFIEVDGRSTTQSGNELNLPQKGLSEEDLMVKLWTLQQTLDGAGFAEDRIRLVLEYILNMSEKVVLGNKESIWGLEESLDWLARECPKTDLPDYENWQKKYLGSKNPSGQRRLSIPAKS